MSDKHVVQNSGDIEQIKDAEDHQKDRERDLEWIVSQPRGRRWLYDHIHSDCHISQRSHVPACTQSSAFNEGARAIGEGVLEEIRQRYPAPYLKMLEENHFDE